MNRRTLRIGAVVVWLLVPTVLLAWHYGPGQDRLAADKAQAFLSKAKAAEAQGKWHEAMLAYTSALGQLPLNDVKARNGVRFAQAKAKMRCGDLPEAMEDLDGLLAEVEKAGNDPALAKEIRGTLGAFHYYAAWLMRLEGASTEEWTEQVEQSRQHYRLLAENAQGTGDVKSAEVNKKNLEAAVRLARMDLNELKGKPIPKECQGCKNVAGKCRSQKEGKCKGEGNKPSEDARQKVSEDKKKGAGMNQREGSGS
jgi:tetratricopeptide (TPR) repeat protein